MNQKQIDAIELILLGHSDNEVSEKIEVTRQTVNGWRNQDPEFIAELNLRRQEIWSTNLDRLRQLILVAINIIATDLENEDEEIRRNAAYFIAKQTSFKEFLEPKGLTNPKRITFEQMLENM